MALRIETESKNYNWMIIVVILLLVGYIAFKEWRDNKHEVELSEVKNRIQLELLKYKADDAYINTLTETKSVSLEQLKLSEKKISTLIDSIQSYQCDSITIEDAVKILNDL